MKYPVDVQALNCQSPADGRNFLSIRFRLHPSLGDPEYNGAEFALPYVKDPAQAKALWEELAKAMTELEKFIGRNSD